MCERDTEQERRPSSVCQRQRDRQRDRQTNREKEIDRQTDTDRDSVRKREGGGGGGAQLTKADKKAQVTVARKLFELSSLSLQS